MDANDRRIVEDSDGVGVCDRPGEDAEERKSDGALPESFFTDSASRADPPSAAKAPEVEKPIRDREISLLEFVPIRRPETRFAPESPAKPFLPSWAAIGLVAGFVCLAGAGAALGYVKVHRLQAQVVRLQDTQNLAAAVNKMESRLGAVEAARDKDQANDLRRLLAEIKSGAATTRDLGTTVGQLSSRVDRIEKDQTARFDKLNDHIDHESSARLADMSARLDKLEKKPATSSVVSVTPAPPPAPKVVQAPVISTELTGTVEKPKPRIRGFTVADVRNGYAVVESRDGPQPVVAGDYIPGAGRVLRIERHGHDWAVVTTTGVITEDMTPY
jgi:hypothetical protein